MIKKIIATAMLTIFSCLVAAGEWPERAVKIVVPLAPGGGNDVIARMVGQELSNIWKQSVIVENKPGGQTTVGATFVAKSEADGYTLLSAQPNILASSSILVDEVHYSWSKDLVPVGFIGAAPPFILAVSAKTGVKNINDLKEYGKNKGVTYASAGTGGPFHIYSALLTQGLNIRGIHVPYKAAPPAVVDVVSGNVDMIFAPLAQIIQHIQSGALIPITVVGNRALDKLPGVPPADSLSIRGFPSIHTNYAIFAPAGIPEHVKQKLNKDITRAYKTILPELLSRNLVDPNTLPPKNFERRAIDDALIWTRLTHQVKD